MEVKSHIKSFPCKLHPSESVQRVLRSQDTDNSLRCVECILANIDNAPKSAFVSLNDFIEEAVKHYASSRGSQTLEGSVPNDLVECLSSEESNVEKLKEHVEKEKAKAIDVFDSLQKKFAELCQSKKQEVCQQLDHQVETMRLNYRYYESIIQKYYSKDTSEGDVDKDTLINKINECNDTKDLEVVVKNIKDDIQGSSSHMSRYEAKIVLEESLQNLCEDFKLVSQKRPKTTFAEENYLEEPLKKLNDLVTTYIESCSQVTVKIEELNFNKGSAVNTKIFKPNDIELVKKWIEPSCERLKLVYRGSRDGFSLKNFHSHCDKYKNTLVVVKDEEGKVYGGFSDQSWEDEESLGKQSEKSWLFSLSEKIQYKNWTVYPLNIRGSYGAGICFGNHADLSIIFSSDLNDGSVFSGHKLSSPAYLIFRPIEYQPSGPKQIGQSSSSMGLKSFTGMIGMPGMPGINTQSSSVSPMQQQLQQLQMHQQKQQLQMQQQTQQLQMQRQQLQQQLQPSLRSVGQQGPTLQGLPPSQTLKLNQDAILKTQQLQIISFDNLKQGTSTFPGFPKMLGMPGMPGGQMQIAPGQFAIKEIEVFYIVPSDNTH